MKIVEALQKVWKKVQPPHLVDDIGKNRVLKILIEVMAEDIGPYMPPLESVDRFVLGAILLSPSETELIQNMWYASNYVFVEAPSLIGLDRHSPEYQKLCSDYIEEGDREISLRNQEVCDSLKNLLKLGLIVLKPSTEDSPAKYYPLN
jgi:hypothetical protein